jgi:hypothetical protein
MTFAARMPKLKSKRSPFRIWTLVWPLALAALLAACSVGGGAALSNVGVSPGAITPGSSGIGKAPGVAQVKYTLGERGPVTVTLGGPVQAMLFAGEQGAGPHLVRFTGVVDISEPAGEATLTRRVVPPGDYTVSVEAGGAKQSAPLRVEQAQGAAPTLRNVTVFPDTISPNGDALSDVAEITFRTNETATLAVDLYGSGGDRIPVLAPSKTGPGEQNVVVTGRDTLDEALPDGVYTATVSVQDPAGYRVEASRPITIEGGGEPDLEVLSVDISPQQLILGGEISVTVRVKNTGDVPLRTQGPDPGYTYSTNESYSSIEGGTLTDKAGLWRVGVDWDGNSGGGPAYRYPYRWGFGKTLMPGEEVVTGGKIRILKQERAMWFYVGVLQEEVRIVRDRLGRTRVGVDF